MIYNKVAWKVAVTIRAWQWVKTERIHSGSAFTRLTDPETKLQRNTDVQTIAVKSEGTALSYMVL